MDHEVADGYTDHADHMAVNDYMVVFVVHYIALSLADHTDPAGYMTVRGVVGYSVTDHNAVLVFQGHMSLLGLGGHTVPAQAGHVAVLDYSHDSLGHNVPDFAALVLGSTLCCVQSHHILEKHPSSDSDCS